MKRNLLTAANLTFMAAIGMASVPSQAATVSFDIQSGSNTQSGFTAVTSFPASDGTVTLSVDTAPSGFRDRGVTAPITGNPDAAILRDLAFWSTTDPITFTLSGLQANTVYTGTFWVFDAESGNNGKNIDFTTSGGTVSLTTDNTDASANPYSLKNITSSGTGTATIVMDHTGGTGGPVSFVNGFMIESTIIPTPSAAIAGLVGLGALAARRRRRG